MLATGGSANQTALTVTVGTMRYVLVGIICGAIVGNILYLALVNRLSHGTIQVGGFVIRAICFVVFLTMPPWWAIALAIFIGAVALEPSNPMVMSIFQGQVSAEMRGRVFGAQRAVATCTFLLGLMLFGGLLSGIWVKRTLVIFVALNVLVPLAMLAQPSLRRIEAPAGPTVLASVE